MKNICNAQSDFTLVKYSFKTVAAFFVIDRWDIWTIWKNLCHISFCGRQVVDKTSIL